MVGARERRLTFMGRYGVWFSAAAFVAPPAWGQTVAPAAPAPQSAEAPAPPQGPAPPGTTAPTEPEQVLLDEDFPDEAQSGAAEPAATCEPSCRSGFVCVRGQCVSACNPPCAAGETCTSAGECAREFGNYAGGVAPAGHSMDSGPSLDYYDTRENDDSKPERNWKRRSPGTMAAGIVLTSIGGLLLPIGLIGLTMGDTRTCHESYNGPASTCTGKDYRPIGAVLALSGVAGVSLGVALIVTGAKRVPKTNASLVFTGNSVSLQGTF